ncbi:MAG: hypothetical protein AAFQ80_03515 [Cyanobacteria bacterium J06621_8]
MTASNKLAEQLITLYRQKFTGVLLITAQDDHQQWEIFIYSGKYLWTEGGYHFHRSWRRNIRYCCPGVNSTQISLRAQPQMRSLSYCLLNTLLQRKIITRNQAIALIKNLSQEIFFDLWQKEYKSSLEYSQETTSAHYLLKAGFNLSLDFINLEQMLFQSQTTWSAWGAKGLASCSPHRAPLLKGYQELQKQLPDLIFSNMTRLLNGQRTLRDLALKMDKSVLDLTCGLVPYFFKGYLRLLEIPDLPPISCSTKD